MKTIRIGGVPEHFNLPWHLGMEQGNFEKAGIRVDWSDFKDGTGGMCRAFREDRIDGAVILTEGIIKGISGGDKVKIVQEFIATPLIWGIHVAAESDFKRLDELEHEKVAISRPGSGSQLMAYVNAGRQGWNMRELDFETVIDIEGAVEALEEGRAAYFMWEHFTTKPLVDKGIFRRLADCPTPWPCFVIAFKDEFLKENPEEVKALLQSLNEITATFKETPELEKLISERYGQRPEDVREWLKCTEWSQQQIGDEELDRVQEELKELALIPQRLKKQELLSDLTGF